MARAQLASESEGESDEVKHSSKTNRNTATGEESNNEEEAREGNGEEDDEPEYEIEQILDAKNGVFPQGRMGYLVKWKGFKEEDNSWVDEEDARNAHDLIEAFWSKKSKENKGRTARKSDVKPSASVGRAGRKSIVDERVSDDESTSTKKRGRGRPRKSKVDSEDEEDERARVKKKAKTNGSAKARKASTPVDNNEKDPIVPSTIKKYRDLTSWEDLVAKIETVEKSGDDLIVFFKLKKNAEPCKEVSSICNEKFPQKMIQFYESNLRWKHSELSDENAGSDQA
ncbi:hypothetical protein HETIRDRAFT_428870 [Heterobasidion irregulare TC 32-1]|uniref:Chromo domain-containing protein n=1 Tax=Heterobasidion irregulare (strain TC 32-1) TaxID=747525 RepID=W4K1N7_HETIT|nr:uncharacterized protein HETIRDRAFT_428870 [Heterobasidion irregulare TC 32-1]ETW79255.1 hypothetical protein HETIRDRAFT_428870 [Heterobasidion irregulare TC 32-1]